MKPKQIVHIYSPRLVRPELAADFKMQIDEPPQDCEIVGPTKLHGDKLSLYADEIFRELDLKESGDG